MPILDVCVVGEINLDLILYGLPKELVLDRELLASGLALTLGSSSAICAHNLAMLGSKVGLSFWANVVAAARKTKQSDTQEIRQVIFILLWEQGAEAKSRKGSQERTGICQRRVSAR